MTGKLLYVLRQLLVALPRTKTRTMKKVWTWHSWRRDSPHPTTRSDDFLTVKSNPRHTHLGVAFTFFTFFYVFSSFSNDDYATVVAINSSALNLLQRGPISVAAAVILLLPPFPDIDHYRCVPHFSRRSTFSSLEVMIWRPSARK